MVNEPVKTIIDHGLTMVNHGESVVALTTMTMVINDGLNEWVDHWSAMARILALATIESIRSSHLVTDGPSCY